MAKSSAMTPMRSLVALHCAVLLFGFAGLFGKWLVLAPVAIVCGRTVVAAATLLAMAWIRRRWPGRCSWSLAINGALLALHWVTFFAAIQMSTVATGLLGFASFPLFVLLLEHMLLRHRWRWTEACTALLVTLGLVLLVPEWTLASLALQGLLLGIASGATFALLAVRNRRLTAARSVAAIAFWQNAVAALVLLPFAWTSVDLTDLNAMTLLQLLLLGTLCTAVAHSLFIASLTRLSAHTASIVTALEPVYGITLAAWLLAEIPDARTCAAALLIVVAAGIASREARHVAVPE